MKKIYFINPMHTAGTILCFDENAIKWISGENQLKKDLRRMNLPESIRNLKSVKYKISDK